MADSDDLTVPSPANSLHSNQVPLARCVRVAKFERLKTDITCRALLLDS